MRDHRRFLNVRGRADNLVGLRLADDQTNPFKLDFPTVAPAADNDGLWDIEVPAEEVEMEEVSIEDKSLDQVVADLILDEEEAIEGYEDAEEAIVANEEISEDEKDEILAVLDHIKEEEEEHIDELTELALSTEEDNSEDKIDEVSEDEEIEVANASEDDDGLAEPVSKEARHKLDLAEELCEDLAKQDISAEVKGFMYNTSAKPSSGLVERIIKYMNDFGGMEPLARDLSEEDPTDVDTENASTITVAWEDGEYVERLDTLATACWEADDTYAGFEYLFTLLYLSGIAVDSAEDTLKEDLKAPEGGESSKQVFIDLSGSSYALRDELTAAALADGHKKDEIVYFDDFGFAEATAAAKQGHNVFLYTKDDDYKFNSELEKFPNVKIKIVSNLQESGKDLKYSRKEIADMVATMVDSLRDLLASKPLVEGLDLHFDSKEINKATAALRKENKKNTPWIKRVREWFDDKVVDIFLRSKTMYELALQSPMGREFQDMIAELIEGIQQDHFAELEEVLLDKASKAGHEFPLENAELRVISKADYYNKHKFVADVLDCLRSRKVKNLVDAVQYVNFDTFTFSLAEPQESAEAQVELKEDYSIPRTFTDCKNLYDAFRVWADRLGYSQGEYPFAFLDHAFMMGTEGREVDDEWYDIKDDFEPWGVWSDLQTINEAGLDYYGFGFEKALQVHADYDKEKLGK